MREDTLKAAREFITSGALLLDTLRVKIAELGDEEEAEDEIEELEQFHTNLEIAISRVEDLIPDLSVA